MRGHLQLQQQQPLEPWPRMAVVHCFIRSREKTAMVVPLLFLLVFFSYYYVAYLLGSLRTIIFAQQMKNENSNKANSASPNRDITEGCTYYCLSH